MEENPEVFLQEPETKSRWRRFNICPWEAGDARKDTKQESRWDALVPLTPEAQPCSGSAVAGLAGRPPHPEPTSSSLTRQSTRQVPSEAAQCCRVWVSLPFLGLSRIVQHPNSNTW